MSLRLFPATFALLFIAGAPAWPQARAPQRPAKQEPVPQGNQLDASPALFTVFAAMLAGGFDAEMDTASSHPIRKSIRDQLVDQDLPSIRALKTFVRTHRQKDPNREFSRYLSYALLIDGPPGFAYRLPVSALPPDVIEFAGLNTILEAFYREARVDKLWDSAQPYFNQAIAQLHDPVILAVQRVNAYMRNPSGYLGRRFQIYVDLLGPPNQLQTRSYLDDYFVVLTPAAELPVDGIQHAYLHYMLDPLVLKYSKQLQEKRALGEFALGSPILEEQYRSDFVLLATESFIKAVESRIQRNPALATQALREGFILTPIFAEQLAKYEKEDRALRLVFPDIVDAIDVKAESKRLESVQFVSERPVHTIRVERVEKPAELSPSEKQLEAAEKAYSDRNLAPAKEMYLKLLQEPDKKSLHAKSYYGLARIAVLERDPELGDRLFRKVLELNPDASTKSWSLLYLARLADSQGDREQAQENYKAALAVDGAPDSVRQAAEKGLKQAFTKK